MEYYKVLPFQGKSRKFALYKTGNNRATHIYFTPAQMEANVASYLFNKDCGISIYNKDGKIIRYIESEKRGS